MRKLHISTKTGFEGLRSQRMIQVLFYPQIISVYVHIVQIDVCVNCILELKTMIVGKITIPWIFFQSCKSRLSKIQTAFFLIWELSHSICTHSASDLYSKDLPIRTTVVLSGECTAEQTSLIPVNEEAMFIHVRTCRDPYSR